MKQAVAGNDNDSDRGKNRRKPNINSSKWERERERNKCSVNSVNHDYWHLLYSKHVISSSNGIANAPNGRQKKSNK